MKVARCKLLSWHLVGSAEENLQKLSQNSHSMDQDMNRRRLEYDAGVVHTQLP